MKREVKFRGKTKDGDWVIGSLIQHQPFLEAKFYIKAVLTGQMKFIPVETATIGQFTGLRDKNGVEIYEGDILKVAMNTDNGYSSFNNVSNEEVQWQSGRLVD